MELGVLVCHIVAGGNFRHIFTHIEWNMLLYVVEVENKVDGIWITNDEKMGIYSLPSAFDKVYQKGVLFYEKEFK